MSKLMKTIITGLALLIGLMVLYCEIPVEAAQLVGNKPLLYVEGYEVTNESIMPGTEFTLTIKIRNYSKHASAEEVVVSVSNPDGVVPEYGTVSLVYIDSIKANSNAEVQMKYTANTVIKGSELNFNIVVSSPECASSAQLRIPVGRLTDFEVSKSTIPEAATMGKTCYASVMVENIGDGAYYDVIMVARSAGTVIASAPMGTISAGKTKTQSVGLVFEAEGTYPVEIVLTYVNTEGEDKEYLISSNNIKVTEAISSTTSKKETDNEVGNTINDDKSVQRIVIICVSGILFIATCCIVLMFMYRRK